MIFAGHKNVPEETLNTDLSCNLDNHAPVYPDLFVYIFLYIYMTLNTSETFNIFFSFLFLYSSWRND